MAGCPLVNTLIETHHEQEKYAKAKPWYQRAFQFWKRRKTSEPLANHRSALERYPAEAEAIYKQILAVLERQNHPEDEGGESFLNEAINELAKIYHTAKPLYERERTAMEQQNSHKVEWCQNKLAEIYNKQGKYAQAELLLKRARKLEQLEDPDKTKK